MKTITFVSTNKQKFEEVKEWIAEFDSSITLEQALIDLPEYQSLDLHEIAHGKALEAWKILKKPVLVDDGGIFLECYHDFPGALSKYVFRGIGLDGFWLLAQEDPRAYFRATLAYMNTPEECHFFDGISKGTVIKPRHPVINKTMPFTEIFIPEGDTKTYAELRGTGEEKKYHHRYQAVQKLVTWLRTR